MGMNGLNLCLKAVKQFAGANAESFGNFYQSVYRRRLFTAFDFADVIVVQVGFFCQSLLAHANFLARATDCFSQNFAMLLGCHCAKRKQEQQNRTTVFRLYFSTCNPLKRAYKQRRLNRVSDLPGFQ
jgi:hypothetical protein